MALEDYTSDAEQKQIYSRRRFLKGIGVLVVGAYLQGTGSYSAETKKQKLEAKIPAEYEKDLGLLECPYGWINGEKERAEFNRLGREYMKVLVQKGKYDPEKKEALKQLFNPCGITAKFRVELAQKYLLRESDPETYLNRHFNEDERKKIKNFYKYMSHQLTKKLKNKEEYEKEFYWSVDTNNPDLSDIIFLFEKLKSLKDIIDFASKMIPFTIGPISSNPLTSRH